MSRCSELLSAHLKSKVKSLSAGEGSGNKNPSSEPRSATPSSRSNHKRSHGEPADDGCSSRKKKKSSTRRSAGKQSGLVTREHISDLLLLTFTTLHYMKTGVDGVLKNAELRVPNVICASICAVEGVGPTVVWTEEEPTSIKCTLCGTHKDYSVITP